MLILVTTVMLLGFILNSFFNVNKSSLNKMLLLLAFVNIISIVVYLTDIRHSFSNDWELVFIFIDITIITLNIIIARYVYNALMNDDSKFEKSILNLFGAIFTCDCLLISLIYIFNSQKNILDVNNRGFWWIYTTLSILMVFGTIIPAVKINFDAKNRQKNTHSLRVLLVLNFINNIIGFYFYTIQFPSKEISTILNMLANLAFGYYLGYFLLVEYFNSKKNQNMKINRTETDLIYSWDELKNHINNWNEVRSYLLKTLPNIVTEVEQYTLSDLEKIHLSLKKLKVTSKEAAEALNVSSRTVETQRYRISKKTEN